MHLCYHHRKFFFLVKAMPRRNSAPKERYEAIEILLLWEGRVSRSRLLDLFDIHETLASRDIAGFRKQHPDACELEMSTKSYVSSRNLEPTLTLGVFSEYQRLVGALGCLNLATTGVPLESTQLDSTVIRYTLFSQIHRAMRLGLCIRIVYRSMSTPEPHERLIRPHSFIQAGPRWHLRAYCAKAAAFRDMNLGRISAVSPESGTNLPGESEDVEWHQMVSVRLVPHEGLTAEQAQMVREEYMGKTAALVFTVRAPLVRYVIQSFRAAVDPAREKAPEHLLMAQHPETLPQSSRWLS